MGQNNIQFCLVPAKGISTTDVLTVKLRSTRKQLKTQTPHFAFHGESGSAPVKSQGGHNGTEDGGSDTSRENKFRLHSLV